MFSPLDAGETLPNVGSPHSSGALLLWRSGESQFYEASVL